MTTAQRTMGITTQQARELRQLITASEDAATDWAVTSMAQGSHSPDAERLHTERLAAWQVLDQYVTSLIDWSL